MTWTLEQVAGPAPSDVPLGEDEAVEGEAMFAFRAPEVDQDTLMEFELTISDGEDITMERISVGIQNIELTPTVSLLGRRLRYLTVFTIRNRPISTPCRSEITRLV